MIYFMTFRGVEYPLWYDKTPKLGNLRRCTGLKELRQNENNFCNLQDVYFEYNEMPNEHHNAISILREMGIRANYDDSFEGWVGARNTLKTYIEKNQLALEFCDYVRSIEILNRDNDLMIDRDYVSVVYYLEYLMEFRDECPRNILKRDNFDFVIEGESPDEEIIRKTCTLISFDAHPEKFNKELLYYFDQREK